MDSFRSVPNTISPQPFIFRIKKLALPMKFFALGLNHETASVKDRACFALTPTQRRELYEQLSQGIQAEFILLSTCNRTEIYTYASPRELPIFVQTLAQYRQTSWPEEKTFLVEDEAAIRHIIQVTAGLRSQVIGDRQILSQVKEAYREAMDAGTVQTVMHRLMHTAFRAARRVLHETNLSPVHASVAHLAVAALRNALSPERPVAILGAGEMARLALESLKTSGFKHITLINRTWQKALELAHTYDIEAIPWEQRYDILTSVQGAIVTTGAEQPVLEATHMPARSTPLLMVDIAVPRNVDRRVDTLPGYQVLDLDTLHAQRLLLQGKEHPDIQHAETICEELLAEFVTWYFHQQALQPAILQLKETFETIRLREIERHAHRFKDTDRDELERLTRSIMQKLLAIPILRLKEAASDSLSLAQRIELLNELFSHPACEDTSETSLTPSEESHEASHRLPRK